MAAAMRDESRVLRRVGTAEDAAVFACNEDGLGRGARGAERGGSRNRPVSAAALVMKSRRVGWSEFGRVFMAGFSGLWVGRSLRLSREAST
ncbi:hypothetical protein CKA38_09180 [Ereboglobus luteus]|uniref:Uncharacterized protein n=1 Tax=Ereboglobus luteus TaxID=1796921 RepID=A0A2U8E3Q7_9BACT|nr:hypothetical protein CKA38_09180 [Ereboglobus luteus]